MVFWFQGPCDENININFYVIDKYSQKISVYVEINRLDKE